MPYLSAAWYVAAWSHDLPPAKPLAATILGEPIVLWRDADGKISALQDRCAHRLAPLSRGRCEGAHLRCLYHGVLFDKSGAAIQAPSQDALPPRLRVRAFPVVEKHNWIWVWMDNPALADESLIPPAIGLDDPDYCLGSGQLDYVAEAQLVIDNLLDFSHLPFVHAESFGASESWANSPPNITALPRGVRIQRWLENEPGMRLSDCGRVDGWTSYDFLIPGVLLMEAAQYSPGAAKACNYGPPPDSLPALFKTFTSQAVTPTESGAARYFFSWGPHISCGGAQMRDALMTVAHQAFTEDKMMIEAQQRAIHAAPNAQMVPIAADRATHLYDKVVERLAHMRSAA